MKAAKSFFNVREKLSPRPRLWPSNTIWRMLKDFAAKVSTTIFVQPKMCNYYKINK
jgi:hypothetical protein